MAILNREFLLLHMKKLITIALLIQVANYIFKSDHQIFNLDNSIYNVF